MDYYQTSLLHIVAELERIDLLVKAHVWQMQKVSVINSTYQGLQINNQEIDNLLEQPPGMPVWAEPVANTYLSEAYIKCAKLQQKINQSVQNSLNQGILLRLVELVNIFQLSSIEMDILLLCLAPELDARYQKFFAYLQDDITQKRPTVDLILNLLSENFADKIRLRQLFSSNQTLIRYNCIESNNESGSNQTISSVTLKLDDRILNYLLENDALDKRLTGYVELIKPKQSLQSLVLADYFKHKLNALIAKISLEQLPTLIYLQGEKNTGRKTLAEAMCQQMDIGMLIIDTEGLSNSSIADFSLLLTLIYREAMLYQSAIYWDNSQVLLGSDKSHQLKMFNRQLEQYNGLVFLAGNVKQQAFATQNKYFINLMLPKPTNQERQQLWLQALDKLSVDIPDQPNEIMDIASRFQLSAGQIFAAAKLAQDLNQWREPGSQFVSAHDFYQACRLCSSHQLSGLAQLIKPTYTRNDIILPEACQVQLDGILNYVRRYALVYEEWGFAKKLAMGKGLNVLFSGPPGTGKTMAAEVIAASLELDLYKIDLSAIVSKYIGETEKNLNQIFAEAEKSNAILFFDEADALFGKRSEVKSSHDRYANIETSYLLQKMEAYQGIVILATNYKGNMDEAFLRRLHFSIDFPTPGPQERLRIWQNIWPTSIALSEEVDLKKLANNVELAGGNIRNVALTAAFKAAEKSIEKPQITTKHLLHAIELEFKKIGRIVHEGQLDKIFV